MCLSPGLQTFGISEPSPPGRHRAPAAGGFKVMGNGTGGGKTAPLAHAMQRQTEAAAKGINARENTKGFKSYTGVGKEERFITASSSATATFYVFEGCYHVLPLSSPEKNQLLLVISANRPLISHPLFCPSVCLSFCIPLEAHRQAPDPKPAAARTQPVPRRDPGLRHLICTTCYETDICLPFEHLGRAEPRRAYRLVEPLSSISTVPIMS